MFEHLQRAVSAIHLLKAFENVAIIFVYMHYLFSIFY